MHSKSLFPNRIILTFTVLPRRTGKTIADRVAGIGWVIRSFGTRVLVRIAGSHWTVVARGTELF